MAFDVAGAKKAGYTDQEIQAHLQGTQNQPKAPILNGLLQLGGGIGGQIVGENVGAGLGAMIPGLGETGISEAAGGYAGATGGAGVGSGVGNAGADLIRKYILGDNTVDMSKTAQNSVDAGKIGAASTAIGGPIAKGLGIALHPVQAAMEGAAPAFKDIPFLAGVNQVLSKSTKSINMSDIDGLLSDFQKDELPKFTDKLMGPQAQKAYDDLISTIGDAYGGNGKTNEKIGKVTVKSAQKIKQALYGMAKDLYGFQGPIEGQVQKGVARYVKGAIDATEPGVKTPNRVASVASAIPNTLGGLTQFLPGPAGKAVSTIAGLPGGVLGGAFPLQAGGVARQALPRELQLLLMGNQAQENSQ